MQEGLEGKEWTVTHHQLMVGRRNTGGSHLWEQQRTNGRLASPVGTDHPPAEVISCPTSTRDTPSLQACTDPSLGEGSSEGHQQHRVIPKPWYVGGEGDAEGKPDEKYVTFTIIPKTSDLEDRRSACQHFSDMAYGIRKRVSFSLALCRFF